MVHVREPFQEMERHSLLEAIITKSQLSCLERAERSLCPDHFSPNLMSIGCAESDTCTLLIPYVGLEVIIQTDFVVLGGDRRPLMHPLLPPMDWAGVEGIVFN